MKVAVTSQGSDLSSEVDERFGRARFFVVVNMESGELSAHDNAQNLSAAQGAGIQAGQNVVKLGVEAVLTGNIGPNAFATLKAGNVKAYIGASGTVQEAIEQFRRGELQAAGGANVEGHWV